MPRIQAEFKGDTKLFTLEISSVVLTKMRETAEAFMEIEEENTDVSCPADYNHAQRQATKDTRLISG